MKVIKVYEIVMNISAVEMFEKNLDDVILRKLRIMEGKCEKNSLIVKILKINKRSDCKISRNQSDGSAELFVLFEAEAIIYEEDSILVGVEIERVEKGKIICTYQNHVIITILGHKNLQSLEKKQKIIVKIKDVSYPKGKEMIAVGAVPYSYSNKFIIYSIPQDVSETIWAENIKILEEKLAEVDNEIKLFTEEEKSKRNFFIDKLYFFHEKFDDFQKRTKLQYLDFLTFIRDLAKKDINNNSDIGAVIEKIAGHYLIRHPIIEKTEPLVINVNKNDLNKISAEILDTSKYEIKIIEENPILVLLSFLGDYLAHIRAIREMCEVYTKEDIEKTHKNLWNIYDKIKK